MKLQRSGSGQRRVHAAPHQWLSMPATDYWFQAGAQDMFTASAAGNISGLDSYGWTTTSLDAFTNSVTGDFISSADDTPPHILANASGDSLLSPAIFGNYSHALLVGEILGYMPTRLCLEFYAAFTVATANEAATLIGFHNNIAIVAAIISNGTNFLLSNNTTTDAGIAVDNAYRRWKIIVDGGTDLIEWLLDDVSQGSIAIREDAWPTAFAAVASTTNRWGLSWVHIWYE